MASKRLSTQMTPSKVPPISKVVELDEELDYEEDGQFSDGDDEQMQIDSQEITVVAQANPVPKSTANTAATAAAAPVVQSIGQLSSVGPVVSQQVDSDNQHAVMEPRLEALIIPSEPMNATAAASDPRIHEDNEILMQTETGEFQSVKPNFDLKSVPWVFDYYKARDDPWVPLDILVRSKTSQDQWIQSADGWMPSESDAKRPRLAEHNFDNESPAVEPQTVEEQNPILAQLEAVCPNKLTRQDPCPLANIGATDGYNAILQLILNIPNLSARIHKRRDANQIIIFDQRDTDLLKVLQVSQELIRVLRAYRFRQVDRSADGAKPQPDTGANLFALFQFVQQFILQVATKDRHFANLEQQVDVVELWEHFTQILAGESHKGELAGCRDELEDWFKLKRKFTFTCDTCEERETNTGSERLIAVDLSICRARNASGSGSSLLGSPRFGASRLKLSGVWEDLCKTQAAQACNRKFDDITAYQNHIGARRPPGGKTAELRCNGRMIASPIVMRLPRILGFKVINRFPDPDETLDTKVSGQAASGGAKQPALLHIPEYLDVDIQKLHKTCQRAERFDPARHRDVYRLTHCIFHTEGQDLAAGRYALAFRTQEPVSGASGGEPSHTGNLWYWVEDTDTRKVTLDYLMPWMERGACLVFYSWQIQEKPLESDWSTGTLEKDLTPGSQRLLMDD